MSKAKCNIEHAIRIPASTDPLRQFLNDNVTPAAECDSLEQIHKNDQVEQYSETDNLKSDKISDTYGEAAKTDTYGEAAKTDTYEEAAKTDTYGEAAKTDTYGEAAKTDTYGEAAKTDTYGEAAKTDTYGKAAKTNTYGEAAKTDTFGKASKTDTYGEAAKTGTLGQAVKNNNSRKPMTTYSSREALTSDNLEIAATADTAEKNAVNYSGEVESNKTLDMNRSIDFKTNNAKYLENPKRFQQHLKDNHSTKAKCKDLVERANKSTMKRTKFKSKKCPSKHFQSNDTLQNKLSNFVDVQQLLNIGYRNPELLPLIKRVSVINDIFPNFRPQAKKELVSIIRIVERTIKEFVYMKQTASNSGEIQDVVYKLLPTLNKSFCGVVLKQSNFILDPTIRNLVEWNKVLKSLQSMKTNESSNKNLFDLSLRFQTKDLVVIGKDHPEFRANIETILGVSSAMKHLNHGGQVEIYKLLRKMENIIKDLVKHKTDPEGCRDIFLTPEVLTSSLDFCIEKILMHLKAAPCIPVKCFQCDLDRSHATEGDIETNMGNRLEVNRTMSVFECANWGVERDRINNLESLIHHLVSKENALEDFWSFQDCVDWFEIASLYSKYRLEIIPDKLKLLSLRRLILEDLNKIEKILEVARSCRDDMKSAAFVNNETLSDAIALSGQIEMLTSGVEHYLNAFAVYSGDVFRLLNEYGVMSLKLRDNRFKFLTKPQWSAFNFPFSVV